MNKFPIFGEMRADEYLRSRLLHVQQMIDREPPDYLLNVNEAEYMAHLKDQFAVDPLVIQFDSIEASSEERNVETEERFDSVDNGTYRRQVITYHLPFSGDAHLLRCQPNPALMWTTPVYIEHGFVCFEIIDWTEVSDDIRSRAEGIISHLRTQVEHLSKQVDRFNAEIGTAIREAFNARKKELLGKRNVLSELGVPIRKSKNVPATFTVPTVRKKVVAKPLASATVKDCVPTIDEASYQDILQTIFEMGRTFERYPNTYADKDEMILRDHLVLLLEPRFEGSTTGETFNKTGKTDILIRYDKANIFVAECKFWDGKVQHFKTIDQLLSYLTWRDSKTAIIYFVQRKEIVPVFEEIARATPEHPCYLRSLERKENGSWQAFEFHLPNDKSCKIKLSVLAFHIPPVS